MSYERAQCFIFFTVKHEQMKPSGGIRLRCATTNHEAPSTSSADSQPISGIAFLAEAYYQAHPIILTLLAKDNIHLAKNHDKFDFTFGYSLGFVECFLDESPSATVEPLSVVLNHLSDDDISIVLLSSTIQIESTQCEAASARPAIDDQNSAAFQLFLERPIKIWGAQGPLLRIGVKRKDYALCRLALDQGADVNVSYGDTTALYQAAQEGSTELVKLLIERGARVDVQDILGYTPLHAACQPCIDKGLAEVLIEAGANVSAKSRMGDTPLHLAVANTEEDNPGVAQLLIAKGAAVDSKSTNGKTPLHCADCSEVIRMLLENGANPNNTDSAGKTPIFYAVQRGCVRSVEALLNYGARVSLKDEDQSILVFAFVFRKLGVFQYLLRRCYFKLSSLVQSGVFKVNFDPLRNPAFSSCFKVFVHHLVLVLALEFNQVTTPEPHKHKDIDVLSIWTNRNAAIAFHKRCQKEIALMKTSLLPDSYVTVFDILFRDEFSNAALLKNDLLSKAAAPEKLRSRFPLYGFFLTYVIEKAKRRKDTLKQGIESLDFLSVPFKKLPDELKETIVCYLDLVDVGFLKKACALPVE